MHILSYASITFHYVCIGTPANISRQMTESVGKTWQSDISARSWGKRMKP